MKSPFHCYDILHSILVLLFFITSISMYSQQNDSLDIKANLPPNLKINNAIITFKEDTIQQGQPKDDLFSKILSEKWDNMRFNPYSGESSKFPFQLVFKDSTYASPIKRKRVITSRYGWRKGRPHRGIDIDLVTGDSVMAMFDGVIRFAKYSTGHGKTIVIRHKNELETGYAHLSKYIVKVNDTIKKGQIIGIGGTTGNARGSHLHLTVSYKGNYINPEYLFDFEQTNLVRNQSIWITRHWTTAHFHTSKKQSKLVYYKTFEEARKNHEEQSKAQIHIVKRGDTLYGISSKYRISLRKLCKSNAISANSVLKIGKKIVIY